MLLRREQGGGAASLLHGEFGLVPDGLNGRAILSQPPTSLLSNYPWGTTSRVLDLAADLAEIEANASLVLLCEHALRGAPQSKELHATMQAAAAAWEARSEVQERRWPMMRFLIAPGPPSEQSRWLRGQCGLPEATASSATLQVLLLDRRNPHEEPSCYSMRGACTLRNWTFDADTLAGDEGAKRLVGFMELFCERMQPPRDEASPYNRPPVRIVMA